jgi:hypothetical protein
MHLLKQCISSLDKLSGERQKLGISFQSFYIEKPFEIRQLKKISKSIPNKV